MPCTPAPRPTCPAACQAWPRGFKRHADTLVSLQTSLTPRALHAHWSLACAGAGTAFYHPESPPLCKGRCSADVGQEEGVGPKRTDMSPVNELRVTNKHHGHRWPQAAGRGLEGGRRSSNSGEQVEILGSQLGWSHPLPALSPLRSHRGAAAQPTAPGLRSQHHNFKANPRS